MNTFAPALLELEARLAELAPHDFSTPEYCLMALKELEVTNKAFRQTISTTPFDTTGEEIRYFKELKPALSAQIIYHATVYDLELKKRARTQRQLKQLYEEELQLIEYFFTKHGELIHYWLSGDTYLDERYFLRSAGSYHRQRAPYYTELDTVQSTGYDLVVAQLLAYQRLEVWLLEQVHACEQPVRYTTPLQHAVVIPPTEKLLRGRQVEKRIGISRSSLQRLRENGQIPFFRINRIIWYREEDIQAFLDSNRHKLFDEEQVLPAKREANPR